MRRVTVNSIVNPGVEPTVLADMKQHLRVTNDMDDNFIQQLMTMARQMIEEFCGIAVVLQTQTMTLDQFPEGGIPWWEGEREGALVSFQLRELEIVRPPLVSIQSITTYSLSNVPATYDLTLGFMSAADPRMPGRFALNVGSIWPVDLRRADAVAVASTNGWDVVNNTTPPVPADLVLAHRMLVASLYTNRGDGTTTIENSNTMGYLTPFVQKKATTNRRGGRRRDRMW
jgi:hypothetical protein